MGLIFVGDRQGSNPGHAETQTAQHIRQPVRRTPSGTLVFLPYHKSGLHRNDPGALELS